MQILEEWNHQHHEPNDFIAAKEALEKMWPLQLCGGIFYIEGQPVAYCLGEELVLCTPYQRMIRNGVTVVQY